jgi:outer membrane protein assembly factor BamA
MISNAFSLIRHPLAKKLVVNLLWMKRILFLLLLLQLFQLIFRPVTSAQTIPDSTSGRNDSLTKGKECPQKDVIDLIFKYRSPASLQNDRFTALVIPYVGYSPVTQFLLGIGGSLSWRLGDPEGTNLSASTVSASITTKKQMIIQLKSNVYTNENQWFLQGDWRFYIYNIPTYGLGTESGYAVPSVPGYEPVVNAEETTVYPMDFDWLKFHQVISRKIGYNFYAGLGYHLDYHFLISDLSLKLDTPDILITPHYAYCEIHGFNRDQYTSSGLSINGTFDTRDNLINSYKGFYVNISYRYNFKMLGSSESGSQLWTEFRTYVSFSKRMPRHLLAFWAYGSFKISGEIPYLDLPATGFDQMNSSGRGYVQGRWRGENLIYAETEYRFPISQCSKILGGVVFINATTASNQDLGFHLFESVRPGVGIGLRVMVSKKNRLNLAIDFGWGMMKSDGFYIQAQEAF